MTASSKKGSSKGSAATVAIVLVTSLFFVWGLTMNLVNALNSPMANFLELLVPRRVCYRLPTMVPIS